MNYNPDLIDLVIADMCCCFLLWLNENKLDMVAGGSERCYKISSGYMFNTLGTVEDPRKRGRGWHRGQVPPTYPPKA